MFGESDSESTKAPSPWDSLPENYPKLAPEADEGNVEYKLQLLNPSPDRFARLVTQLKWRLLEGGGQAYYELGVADSGILVGLPAQQLEESLETLDMMAAEIEASVVVVKEIEVPPELSRLAESQLENWDGRRKMKLDGSPAMSATESDTDFSNLDLSDIEETTCSSPATSATSLRGQFDLSHPNPSPSPNLLSIDPILAMFTMDLGEEVADNESLDDDDIPTDCVTKFAVTLEISPVYKPRPVKKRSIRVPSSSHSEYTKKRPHNGHHPPDAPCHTGDSIDQNLDETLPKGAKAKCHRGKRSKRRELKLGSLPLEWVGDSVELRVVDHHAIPSHTTVEPNVSFLDSQPCDAFQTPVVPSEPQVTTVDPPWASDTSGTTTIVSKEPRLIVEVLVFWELSLDDVFLDFQGFSLQ